MSQDFGDGEDLLERIEFLRDRVVYLVGSAISAPSIPDAEGIIALVRKALPERDVGRLDAVLAENSGNRYQATFRHLSRVRGQDFANTVIRDAVLTARRPSPRFPEVPKGSECDEDTGLELEDDVEGWVLTPGAIALGEILARASGDPRSLVLTTGFDPLIQVGIVRAGGAALSVGLDSDNTLHNLGNAPCLIGQLNGHWCRGDTLHSAVQLGRDRPKLAASLARLLGERPLLVLGHSGCNDILTRSLVQLIRGSHAPIEVMWTFHSDDPVQIETGYSALLADLGPGIERGRVVVYKAIDVHRFLPELAGRLRRPADISPEREERTTPIRPLEIGPYGLITRFSAATELLPGDLRAVGITALPASLLLGPLHVGAFGGMTTEAGELLERLLPYRDVILLAAQVLVVRGHCLGWIGATARNTPVLVLADGHTVLADELPPGDDELALVRALARGHHGPLAIVVPSTPLEAALPKYVWNALEQVRRLATSRDYLQACVHFRRNAGITLRPHQIESGSGRETLVAAVRTWIDRGPPLMALLGHPGSGRTTALAQLSAELAYEALSKPRAPLVVTLCADDLSNDERFAEALSLCVGGDRLPAILLALRYGECIALIDDTDRSAWLGESGLPEMLLSGSLEFFGASSNRSRALVAWSPGLPRDRMGRMPSICLAPLAAPPQSFTSMGPTTMLEVGLRASLISLACRRPGCFGAPGREPSLMDPASDVFTRTGTAFAAYILGWAERTALWGPLAATADVLAFVEAVALCLWRRLPEVPGDEVPWNVLLRNYAGPALPREIEDESLEPLLDGTILGRGERGQAYPPSEAMQWFESAIRDEQGEPRLQRRFLSTPGDPGSVRFVFPGLLEFMIAERVRAGLARADGSVLYLPRLSPTVVGFIVRGDGRAGVREALQVILATEYRRRISENALLLAIGDPQLGSAKAAPWQLRGARLRRMELTGARLAYARLEGAELEGAGLTRAQLTEAWLQTANLRYAHLEDADLRGCHAGGVDFTAAWIDGIQLQSADLTAADLSATTALSAAPEFGEVAPSSNVGRWSSLWRPYVFAAPEPPELVGPAALARFTDLAWSPARAAPMLAAATDGGYVYLFEAQRGRVHGRLRVHDGGRTRLEFSSDGRTLAAFRVGHPGLTLWDLADLSELPVPELAQIVVYGVAWARVRPLLAIFSRAPSPSLYDLRTRGVRALRASPSPCTGGGFCAGDTQLMGFAEQRGRLELWSLDDHEVELPTLPEIPDGIWSLTPSPDGRRVITCGHQTGRLLELGEGGWRLTHSFGHGSIDPHAAQFTPDGQVVGLLGDNHRLTLRSVVDGREVRALSEVALPQIGGPLSFSPDGRMIATLDDAGDMSVSDLRGGGAHFSTATAGAWLIAAALGADGTGLVIGCHDHLAEICNLNGVWVYRRLVAERGVAISPQGGHAACYRNGELSMHSRSSSTTVLLDSATGNVAPFRDARFGGEAGPLWVNWNDGRGMRLNAFSVGTGAPDRLRSIDVADVGLCGWACDGDTIAAIVRERETSACGLLLRIEDGSGQVRMFCLDSDPVDSRLVLGPSLLAIVFRSGKLKVYDRSALMRAHAGQNVGCPSLAEFPALWDTQHAGDIAVVAFSPDEQQLAVASGTRVEILHAHTGACLATLAGHEALVFQVQWSVDRLLTLSRDTVRIWRRTDWSLLGTVHLMNGGAWIVAGNGVLSLGKPTAPLYLVEGRQCIPFDLSTAQHMQVPGATADALAACFGPSDGSSPRPARTR